MTSTRHGAAGKELERISSTCKTAWRMAHALHKRVAAADDQGHSPDMSRSMKP
jgi:hypothetical protein